MYCASHEQDIDVLCIIYSGYKSGLFINWYVFKDVDKHSLKI